MRLRLCKSRYAAFYSSFSRTLLHEFQSPDFWLLETLVLKIRVLLVKFLIRQKFWWKRSEIQQIRRGRGGAVSSVESGRKPSEGGAGAEGEGRLDAERSVLAGAALGLEQRRVPVEAQPTHRPRGSFLAALESRFFYRFFSAAYAANVRLRRDDRSPA